MTTLTSAEHPGMHKGQPISRRDWSRVLVTLQLNQEMSQSQHILQWDLKTKGENRMARHFCAIERTDPHLLLCHIEEHCWEYCRSNACFSIGQGIFCLNMNPYGLNISIHYALLNYHSVSPNIFLSNFQIILNKHHSQEREWWVYETFGCFIYLGYKHFTKNFRAISFYDLAT